MIRGGYLGMRSGDLEARPYARYWNPVMEPVQSQVQQAILHGAEASDLGFTIDRADRLKAPGYLPLENGWTTLTSGQVFVAVLTRMPGVTGAMFEWWMGWHYMENQRYKLWHPRAHVANGTKDMRGDDPDLSDREKYMTTHHVTEFIGDHCEDITITFQDPDLFFADTSDFLARDITATVCGKVGLQHAPVNVGYLIHQIREVEGGSEMRSRFWLGKPELKGLRPDGRINRMIGSKWITGRLAGSNIGRAMVVHCGMEMNHLAGFLPDLYADYHAETGGQSRSSSAT